MTDFSLPTPQLESSIARRFGPAVHSQACVIHAVMLHDIKARFFGNGWGYVLTILWPGAHVALLVIAHSIKGKSVPYGDSAVLYAVTGVLPFIIWNYLSRFTMRGVMSNMPFLQYPVIKFMDLIVARQILEVVSCTIVTICLMVVLFLCQIQFWPHHLAQSVTGLGAAFMLGIGFGMVNGQIVRFFPFWNLLYLIILISLYLTSGAVIIRPEELPTKYAEILAWNPVMHLVEWFRSGFYDDYPTWLLSKSYVCYVSGITFVIGLIMDRIARWF